MHCGQSPKTTNKIVLDTWRAGQYNPRLMQFVASYRTELQ